MELAWNFFMDLESALYKTYFTQKVKSSTVPLGFSS